MHEQKPEESTVKARRLVSELYPWHLFLLVITNRVRLLVKQSAPDIKNESPNKIVKLLATLEKVPFPNDARGVYLTIYHTEQENTKHYGFRVALVVTAETLRTLKIYYPLKANQQEMLEEIKATDLEADLREILPQDKLFMIPYITSHEFMRVTELDNELAAVMRNAQLALNLAEYEDATTKFPVFVLSTEGAVSQLEQLSLEHAQEEDLLTIPFSVR